MCSRCRGVNQHAWTGGTFVAGDIEVCTECDTFWGSAGWESHAYGQLHRGRLWPLPPTCQQAEAPSSLDPIGDWQLLGHQDPIVTEPR